MNTCHSGGAMGADLAWGHYANLKNHKVVHYSFQGHRTNAPKDQVVVLTHEQLKVADSYLEETNKTLKRTVPYSKPWILNLLRRNYYQINNSSSLYAIGTLKNNQVEGGTAWAVIMFQNMKPNQPCFLFEQNLNYWLSFENNQWNKINKPITPENNWTGIGSRKLFENGLNAIKELL